MPGFMPGIHAFFLTPESKAWMAGTSPAMTGAHFMPYITLMILELVE